MDFTSCLNEESEKGLNKLDSTSRNKLGVRSARGELCGRRIHIDGYKRV